MRPLDDTALLDVWEHGRAGSPAARSLLLLAEAVPELDLEAWVALSVGEGDTAVLRLRQATFGAQLPAEIACPHCAELLEFALDANELLRGCEPPLARCCVLEDGTAFRLPGHADLAAIAGLGDTDAAVRRLAARCCLDAEAAEELADSAVAAAEASLGMLDAHAAIQLRLVCAGCGRNWTEAFDIGAYFWTEIEQRACALLDEVHILATAYGWSESAILALSAARRTAYLERCGM